MKTFYYTCILLLLALQLNAQNLEDNLIVVTVTDTTKLYERVRQAITYTEFIIREDSKRDTLITYSTRIYNKTIFVVAKVTIAGNQVKISGAHGLGLEDFWGYPAWPKSYKRVEFFKGSESWQILKSIAIKLDSKIEFMRLE